MGQKAYKERLKEIEMSEYDDKVYTEYSLPVQNQVKYNLSHFWLVLFLFK